MTKPAGSKENARLVLDIYAHFGSEPGQVLRASNFVAVGARRRIPMARIQSGIHYAERTHWIEQTDNGSLRLTARGYEAMRNPVHAR